MGIKKSVIKSIIIIGSAMKLIDSKLFQGLALSIFNFLLSENEQIKIGKSRIVIRPSEEGFYYFYYELIEPGVTKFLKENLNKGDTFIDIGAHIGYYSLLAREIVGKSGEVIAFEPHPENYKKLVKNVEMNLYENIIVEKMAIFEKTTILPLFLGTDSSTHTIRRPDTFFKNECIKVRTISLDAYCKLHEVVPNFIKIDVEGVELNVLKGMKETIIKHHPILVCEVHPDFFRRDIGKWKKMFEFLSENYDLFLIQENGLIEKSKDEICEICKRVVTNKFGMKVYPRICMK